VMTHSTVISIGKMPIDHQQKISYEKDPTRDLIWSSWYQSLPIPDEKEPMDGAYTWQYSLGHAQCKPFAPPTTTILSHKTMSPPPANWPDTPSLRQ
jgi:hypothetical protein